MNLALFSYNFPHKKTQDFLLRLLVEDIRPTVVLASDPVELRMSAPTIRAKPRHVDLVHPRQICEQFSVPYHVVSHNGSRCHQILQTENIDIGLISGARILSPETIQVVKKGIINIHPGLLPEVRGMDALQWAIYEKHPFGVTAHVIDQSVDAGYLLAKVIIPEYEDDTLIDLSLRLQQTQNNIIAQAIHQLDSTTLDKLAPIDTKMPAHRKMKPELEAQIPALLKRRLLAEKRYQ